MSAASWSGDFRRGRKATARRAGDEQHLEHLLEPREVGQPGVVLPPVPERERRVAVDLRRDRPVPEHARGVERVRLEQQHPEARDGRAARSAPAKISAVRASSSGTRGRSPTAARPAARRTSSRPRTRRTRRAPRREVQSQKPQIRKAGMIASFVFELEAYCVNGYAAQANASVTPSRLPPNRRPTSPSPSRQSRSNAIDVKCEAGRSSHFPLQPKKRVARGCRRCTTSARRCRRSGSRPRSGRSSGSAGGSRRRGRPGRTPSALPSIGKFPYGDWPCDDPLGADRPGEADVDHVRVADVQPDLEAARGRRSRRRAATPATAAARSGGGRSRIPIQIVRPSR